MHRLPTTTTPPDLYKYTFHLGQIHVIVHNNHRNPLLVLNCRFRLLFRSGTSIPFSSSSFSFPTNPQFSLVVADLIVPLPYTARDFKVSSSLSNLNAFSFSSRSSRSALRAASCTLLSEDCSSSIAFSNFSTLSLARATSSSSCRFAFSFRSICNCRSLTVRSTLRTLRADFDCAVTWASS
jgi:hypothetical protein